MKRIITQILPILAFIFSMSFAAMAQTKVAGNVRDAASKEALIGVSISVKGKVIGTISDVKGNFSLSTTTPVPFTLSVSMVGYERQEILVSSAKSNLNISLKEQATLGQDVVVSASRIEESVLESPVTIEKMDIRAIRESAAPSFYDALRNMKGVETSTQSLSFSSMPFDDQKYVVPSLDRSSVFVLIHVGVASSTVQAYICISTVTPALLLLCI